LLPFLQVPLYDLRSPLGVAPAALTGGHVQSLPDEHHSTTHSNASHSLLVKAVSALKEVPLPPSLIAARAFSASRADLRAKVASLGQVGTWGPLLRMPDEHNSLLS
jgi:hypothetical protein